MLVVGLLWAGQARAQTVSASVTITMTPAVVVSLGLSGSTTPLGAPTLADFTTGYRAATGPLVTVKSNTAYTVSISSSAATFGYTGSHPNPNKPRTDLTWSAVAGGPFTGLLGSGASFLTGTATNSTAATAYYRTLWNLAAAPPGDYSLTVQFTISAP